MTRASLLGVLLLLQGASAACHRPKIEPAPAPALDAGATRLVAKGAIGNGTTSWFHVRPEDPLLDARLDLGSLHSSEDASVDIVVEWPIDPGEQRDARLRGENMPDDARAFERSRVLCGPTGPLSFPLESYKLDGDGGDLSRLAYDPVAEKMKAHAWSGRPYADDVYSLACYLAARKCAGEDARWPAKDPSLFVPRCRLQE